MFPEAHADYADTDQFDIVPVETIVGLNIVGLVGNSLDPDSPFADARVRKAITYAINQGRDCPIAI